MFKINPITKQIDLTRGDVATIRISTKNGDGTDYVFQAGDVIRFSVYKKKDCHCVELVKDTQVEEETTIVDISLRSEDTKIGDIISKDTDYWYEVVLNPDTLPQTIIGYEIDPETNKPWEKILKLLPEANDKGSDE
jgi:hypothetical protein